MRGRRDVPFPASQGDRRMIKPPPGRKSDVYVSLNNIKTIMIMNRNIRQTLLAPAVLLLAVTLGLAGCTQGEDALQGADGNNGARTLNINVGPKQGFISGNTDSNAYSNAPGSTYSNDPATRSTVDESTGAMSWEEGDRIFLLTEYQDAAYTKNRYTLVRTATDTWDIYEDYLTTYDADGNSINLSDHTPISAIKIPLGATGIVQVRANYTDNPTRLVSTGNGADFLDGGSRDFMYFTAHSPSMDAAISLNMTRGYLTRLHFPGGLTPGKKYYVDNFSSKSSFSETGSGSDVKFPFTAAADGSLTLCAEIEGNKTVTLKEKDDDADDSNDKVVYTATFNAAFGSSYRCIIPAAGGVDPDSRPNLLIPDPIVAGNKVYAMNGYFVTAPDANESKEYQWAVSTTATVMDSDPCAGHGNWRMPTMKDFETMAGWTTGNPWSQDGASTSDTAVTSDKDAWNAAFPNGLYWSSVARTSDSNAWIMLSGGYGTANYSWSGKTNTRNVRCVQVQ